MNLPGSSRLARWEGQSLEIGREMDGRAVVKRSIFVPLIVVAGLGLGVSAAVAVASSDETKGPSALETRSVLDCEMSSTGDYTWEGEEDPAEAINEDVASSTTVEPDQSLDATAANFIRLSGAAEKFPDLRIVLPEVAESTARVELVSGDSLVGTLDYEKGETEWRLQTSHICAK